MYRLPTFPGQGDRVLLAWSGGKDASWALHVLRSGGADVGGLLCTINEAFQRVSMHSTRTEIIHAQAREAGLPLWKIPLPWPCSNEDYEERITVALQRAKDAGFTGVAFGDLYLEEVRRYREERHAPLGMELWFPLWTGPEDTAALSSEMLAAGLKAKVCSVDRKALGLDFLGREYDASVIADLPSGVDPCGENGEFHTICFAGPMFRNDLPLQAGELVERGGFGYADFLLAGSGGERGRS